MNKIVRYSISFGIGFFMLLILATILHKMPVESSGGVLNGETMIQYLNPTAGIFIYIMAVIAIFCSSVVGRKTVGDPISGLISWGIAVFRCIGTLALVSGGACIYLFENKLFQWIQLFMPVLVLGIQYSLSSRKRDE